MLLAVPKKQQVAAATVIPGKTPGDQATRP